MQNRSARQREERETTVRNRLPVNDDEVLELRGYNSLPTQLMRELPGRAAAKGLPARPIATGEGVAPLAILSLLAEIAAGGADANAKSGWARGASAAPQPLREEFAVERLLLALWDAAPPTPAEEALRVEALALEEKLEQVKEERGGGGGG